MAKIEFIIFFKNDNIYFYLKREKFFKRPSRDIRVSYSKDPSTGLAKSLDQNDYYPFGMSHLKSVPSVYDPMSVPYNYKFGGKELQETGFYDFGARNYMPDLGRWFAIDPLAELRPDLSPFRYAFNNPISFTDPTGLYEEGGGGGDWDSDNDVPEQITTEFHIKIGPLHNNDNDSWINNLMIDWKDTITHGGGDTNSVDNFRDSEDQNYLSDGMDFNYQTDPPISNKDITPYQLGIEWLSGTGPRHRNFTNGDLMTEMLRKHNHVEETRSKIINAVKNGKRLDGVNSYVLGGFKGVGLYLKDYSTLLTAGYTGNLAVTYLGSYDLQWTAKVSGKNIVVTYVVENSSTMQSASRPPVVGYLPIWRNTVGSTINDTFKTGAGSKTTQTFKWTEILPIK